MSIQFHFCVIIAFAMYLKPVNGGSCCIWKLYDDVTEIQQLLGSPQQPPNSSCPSPYKWSPCSDASSCINIYCTGKVTQFISTIAISGYGPSCTYSAQVAQNGLNGMDGVSGSVCTASQGVFLDNTASGTFSSSNAMASAYAQTSTVFPATTSTTQLQVVSIQFLRR